MITRQSVVELTKDTFVDADEIIRALSPRLGGQRTDYKVFNETALSLHKYKERLAKMGVDVEFGITSVMTDLVSLPVNLNTEDLNTYTPYIESLKIPENFNKTLTIDLKSINDGVIDISKMTFLRYLCNTNDRIVVDATGYSLPDHVISNIGTLLETVETMLSPNVQIIYDQNLLSQIGDAIYKTEITPIIYNKSNKPTFGTLIAQVQTFGYMLDLTKLIYTKRFDSEHKFFVVSARSKDEFATASKAVKCIRALNESANFDIKSQFKLRVLLEASEFGDPEKLRYLLNCLAIAICKVPIIEINPESGHCEYSREFIEISNKISNQVNTILNECEYFSNKSLTA